MKRKDVIGALLRIAVLAALGLVGLIAHYWQWRYHGGPAFSVELVVSAGSFLVALLFLFLLRTLIRLPRREPPNALCPAPQAFRRDRQDRAGAHAREAGQALRPLAGLLPDSRAAAAVRSGRTDRLQHSLTCNKAP